MGRMFGGTNTGGRMFGGGSTRAPSTEQIIERAESRPDLYEKPKEKVGILTRIANVASSFEPGGDLATAYRVKKKKLKEGATRGEAMRAGLTGGAKQYGTDVLRGLGSAFSPLDKWTNPNELYQNQEGFTEAYEEAYGKPKTKMGQIGQKTAGIAADILVDPGNILLVGLLGKALKGITGTAKFATKTGVKGLSKFEKGRKFVEGTSKAIEAGKEAFIPAYKVNKVAPELVDFVKKLRNETAMGDEEAVKKTVELVKKYGVDAIKKAPYEIEEGGKLSPAAREFSDILMKETAGEVELGLRKISRPNYTPHKALKYTKEGGQSGYSAGPKQFSTNMDSTKGRVYDTLKEGEKAGIEYEEGHLALARRLAESQRAQRVKGALNEMIAGTVKDIDGNPLMKPLKKAEEMLPGYVPVIVDKNGIKVADKTLQFYPAVNEAGKDIVGVTSRKAIYQMPQDAADYLTSAQKVFANDNATNEVIKMYDRVLNFWKGSVTSVFPAFHVRNAMGNIFNNFVGGVTNPLSYSDAAKIQKGSGALSPDLKKLFPDAETYEDVKKILKVSGVTGKGQFAVDVPELFAEMSSQTNILKKAAKSPQLTGTIIEDNARIAHFVDKLKAGKNYKEAGDSVNKFLFDYSDLTPFERNVMKRIIPFYTFSRKNIPLQLEQMVKQPVKYKAVFDAIRGLKSGDLTPEERKYLPEYLTDSFGITAGRTPEGDPNILAGLGLPFEDLGKLDNPLQANMEMVNPLIKGAVEIPTGVSTFYEDRGGVSQKIEDVTAYNSTNKGMGDMIKKIPALAKFLELKETKTKKGDTYYNVDPWKMYYLKLFAGRAVSTLEKSVDPRKEGWQRALNALTGTKIYTPDIEREKEETLKKILKQMGISKTFEKDYVPADIKRELGFPVRD